MEKTEPKKVLNEEDKTEKVINTEIPDEELSQTSGSLQITSLAAGRKPKEEPIDPSKIRVPDYL